MANDEAGRPQRPHARTIPLREALPSDPAPQPRPSVNRGTVPMGLGALARATPNPAPNPEVSGIALTEPVTPPAEPAVSALADTAPAIDDEPTPIETPSFDFEKVHRRLTGEFRVDAAPAPAENSNDGSFEASRTLRTPASFAEQKTPVLQPGARLGPYLVVRLVGEGGMGEVYEASHVTTGKAFALKVLKRKYWQNDVIVERFVAEGAVMMECRGHPSLPEIQEVAESPQIGPYIVMELLAGKTLAQVLAEYRARGKRMDLATALTIIIVVADTLHVAHQLAIINRDVKPQNIFLVRREDGSFRVIVLDWGAAKSKHSPNTTDTATTIATAPYMAPEQVERRRVTGAADQYSLNHVLYECLYEYAFAKGTRDNAPDLLLYMLWHRTATIDPLPSWAAPPDLWSVMERAFSKNPADRYPSMRAYADALRVVLARKPRLESEPAIDYKREPTRKLRTQSRDLEKPRGGIPEGEVRDPKRRVGLQEHCAFPTLWIARPPELANHRFELGADGVIGKNPREADLIMNHDTVSNRHCRYAYVTGGGADPVFALEDLGSSNGTEVEHLPVRGGTTVKVGEVIRLGDVHAVVMPAGWFEDEDGSRFCAARSSQRISAPASAKERVANAPPSAGSPARSIFPAVIACLVVIIFGAVALAFAVSRGWL